jgi:predicted glycosyltransferase
MKIWVDILTPKQVMLFERLIKELEQDGHTVLATTREYRETNQLLERKGINTKLVGKHGGKTLGGKLKASLERISMLQELVEKEKPSISFGLAPPELARVSFGLKLPFICMADMPESNAVSRLSVPLSSLLITPKLIPKNTWNKYGILEDKIIQYNALDPVGWLKDFKPDENTLNELGIDNQKMLITFRAEESHASYLDNEGKELHIIPTVNSLMDSFPDANFVVLGRYKEQIKAIKEQLNGKAIVPEKVVDGPSLLHYSNLFIGCGGTMTLESALLGTPTIDCRRISTLYEDYAIKQGLVHKFASAQDTVTFAKEVLNNHGHYKKELDKKSSELMKSMEDPIQVIKREIENFK